MQPRGEESHAKGEEPGRRQGEEKSLIVSLQAKCWAFFQWRSLGGPGAGRQE